MHQNKILKIDEFSCGSKAGENPPLLLATIFYDGQKMVSDHQNGIFDEETALKQIILAELSSQKFHVPIALDLTASSPLAMIRYIDFVSKNSNLPFVIDSSALEPRLAGLKHCREKGLLNRVIYNSISKDSPQEELLALREYHPAAVILLGIDENDYTPAGTVRLLHKILPAIQGNQIQNIIVDVCVLDQVSLKCATKIALAVKKEFGLPAGGAPCNGIYMWDRLKTFSGDLFNTALAGTIAYATGRGFDFAFSGPVKTIEKTSLTVAVSSIYDRYYIQQEKSDLSENHPINFLF